MTNDTMPKIGDVIPDAATFNLLPVGAVLTDHQGWVHIKTADDDPGYGGGNITTTYVDNLGSEGVFGACWKWGAVLTSLPEADDLEPDNLTGMDLGDGVEQFDLGPEVATLRAENARLREQVARLSALRTYVQENLLTDDQIAACAGFTHGYKAGVLR